MSQYLIRLELTDNDKYLAGDSECGYEIIAPLNSDSMLDVDQWKRNPDRFTVRRFWRNESDITGMLIHMGGDSWHFHYSERDVQEEPTYQFGRVEFAVGKYANLRDHASDMKIFRIAKVEPA